MSRRPVVLQVAVAIGILVIGMLVYLLDRQPASVYFMPDWITLANNFSPIFGEIGNYLPTFIHAFAFILLTAIVVAPTSSQVVLICLVWFAVDSFFEIAQITPIAQWITGHVPDWFAGVPFLENTSAYFIKGTFDFWDIASIAVGAVAAYLTFQLSQHRRGHHVHET